MKKQFLFLVIFTFSVSIIYGQDWLWSNHFSGDGMNKVASSVIDTSDNSIYVLGMFDGTVDNQGTPMTSSSGSDDIFLDKYNSSGTLLWRKRAGSIEDEFSASIAIDASGSVYITGGFRNEAKFDTDTLTSTGIVDIFLAKYSSNGALMWVTNAGWTGSIQRSFDVSIDNVNNNILLCGFFKDSIYFGPESAPIDTLYGTGFDNFVSKYDLDGNYISSKAYLGNTNSTRLTDIEVSQTGYYISGYFLNDFDTDLGTLTSNNASSDIILIKTDFSFNDQWTRVIGGEDTDLIFGLSVGENDDAYLGGYFRSNSLAIEGTASILSTVGVNDIITIKYDNSGTLEWYDQRGRTQNDVLYGLAYLNSEIIVTGYFTDSLYFGTDTLIASNSTNRDAFFMVYDEQGNTINAKQIRGGLGDEAWGCGIDSYGNYIFSGHFESDTLFIESDIDISNVDTLINPLVGALDMFIAKYGCQVVSLGFLVDSVDCAGDVDGEIILQPSIPDNYSYTWTGGFPDNDTIIGVPEGTYYVTVTSPRGCMYMDSVIMAAQPVLQTSMIDSITINCIAGNDGVAIVTPVNGVGPFTYTWSASVSTDSTASDLTVGLHYVTVMDVCNVPTVDSVGVGYMPTLTTTISSHSILVLCEASTNGEATVTPVDGVGPYNYIWTTSVNDTLPVNTNLSVGMHYVSVTDICNVPTIDSVQVNYLPTMNASITEDENASCSTTADGEAFVFATSGVPPYDYIWDNGDTLAQTNALDTGWHYVTVTDFCISIVDSVLIDFNAVMSIDFSSHEDVSCPGNTDGEACIAAAAGTPPYFYNWAGSVSTNSCVNDLAVGWQTVTVTDACGSLSDSVFIGTMPTLITSVQQTVLATCASDSNATAVVTTTNGAAPFTYVWSGSTTTDSAATDLGVGWQFVTITDGCGDRVDSINIDYITPLSASYIATNVSCNNDTTGEIILIPSDGVAPFVYSWTTVSDTDSIASGLSAGTYSFTITDACGSVTDDIELTEPGAISVSSDIKNESFTGTADGEIDILVSGGVAPYLYLWSDENNSTTEDLTMLSEDTFYVTITDYNNCVLIDTFAVVTEYKYIEIKNAFTPNGDATNDEWTIKYIDQYPGCKVNVFNQWGMNVFSSQGYKEKWNGKKDNTGNDLPAAAYYYIIDLGDGSDQYTGAVTIIR